MKWAPWQLVLWLMEQHLRCAAQHTALKPASATACLQVQQLRQQLEAEKSRGMMLEAQLEAAQHSRRTGARQRRRCRQSQPDWQAALGSSGDDCSGCACVPPCCSPGEFFIVWVTP